MAAPPKVLTNDDMVKIVDTNDEWIDQRTGIRQRHIVEDGQNARHLGFEAVAQAIKNAGIEPTE
ncbi:MAG: 3-oxoacyl-ACP synthase, partial [Phycisphaeraceae bacterium]|nr:3-oxoacyl-ACP synthase [Phycisphaeraceae bacterium]